MAGKPEPPLFRETLRRVGGEHPLVVGDRLDTDIAGAHRAGWDSLLVLTGVSGLEDLVAATPELRPTYISPDLAGLGEAHRAPEQDGTRASAGGWTASVDRGRLRVDGDGEPADWWRAVACCRVGAPRRARRAGRHVRAVGAGRGPRVA